MRTTIRALRKLVTSSLDEARTTVNPINDLTDMCAHALGMVRGVESELLRVIDEHPGLTVEAMYPIMVETDDIGGRIELCMQACNIFGSQRKMFGNQTTRPSRMEIHPSCASGWCERVQMMIWRSSRKPVELSSGPKPSFDGWCSWFEPFRALVTELNAFLNGTLNPQVAKIDRESGYRFTGMRIPLFDDDLIVTWLSRSYSSMDSC